MSLGIEEQFYILWPLTLIVILRYFGRNTAWRIVLIIILMTMGVRAVLVVNGVSPELMYTALYTRIDSILVGCWLALVPVTRYHWLAARFSMPPILILATTLFLLEWKSRFYFLFGITTVALCAAWLVVAVLFGRSQNLLRWFLRLPPLNYLGRISYGFYLWHYPICVAVADHVNAQYFGELKIALISAVSTLFIASTSYYVLELPFLKLRHKFKSHADATIVDPAVWQFSELIVRQRRLIEQIERDGNDATSAKNILDSLCLSLSLCMHDRHRVEVYIDAEHPEGDLAGQTSVKLINNYEVEPKSALSHLSHALRRPALGKMSDDERAMLDILSMHHADREMTCAKCGSGLIAPRWSGAPGRPSGH